MAKPRRKSYESILSISAIAIALISAFFAGYQAILAREHNRMSVEPFLTWQYHSNGGDLLSIKVINAGLGPAIIKTLNYSFGSQSPVLFSWKSCETLTQILGLTATRTCYNHERDWVMMSGDEIVVFEAKSQFGLSVNQSFILDQAKKLDLDFEYCSMYDVCKAH